MSLPSVQHTQNSPSNCCLNVNQPKNETSDDVSDLIFKILQLVTENKIGMSVGVLSLGLGLHTIFDIKTKYAHLFSGNSPLLTETFLIFGNLLTASHVGKLAQRLFNQYQKGTNYTNVLKTTSEVTSSYAGAILRLSAVHAGHCAATYIIRPIIRSLCT